MLVTAIEPSPANLTARSVWRMSHLDLCVLPVWPGLRRAGLPRPSPALASSSRTKGAAGSLAVVPASSVCWRSCLLAAVRGRCCTFLLYTEAPNGFQVGPWFGVETAPTWAFSVSSCYVTQDHPVYIPRAVQRLVRWMVIEHLIRRSMESVRPALRNPKSRISVLLGVRNGRHSPVPSGQSVRKR